MLTYYFKMFKIPERFGIGYVIKHANLEGGTLTELSVYCKSNLNVT